MKNLKFDNTSSILKKTKPGLGTGELNLALAQATECGIGINPLKGYIVLPNFNSVSGDRDGRVALYIVNGALEIGTVAEVEAAINSYCTNPIVSATGAIITGCLTDTDLTEGTRQLTATVLPAGASQAGTWTSSVPTRAIVSPTGLVYHIGATVGDTVITFTSTDGAFTATCTITVT